jgi:hypothetical protein
MPGEVARQGNPNDPDSNRVGSSFQPKHGTKYLQLRNSGSDPTQNPKEMDKSSIRAFVY